MLLYLWRKMATKMATKTANIGRHGREGARPGEAGTVTGVAKQLE